MKKEQLGVFFKSSEFDPLSAFSSTAADGETGFVAVDRRCHIVFRIPALFETCNKMVNHGRERMSVNIPRFFNTGVNGKELFLLLKTAQKEPVVENGSILADNVDICRIGHESRKGTGEHPFCAVGKPRDLPDPGIKPQSPARGCLAI